MQTSLQTQPDLSEIATRMLDQLFAHILGLAEPAFPLAFGEYSTSTSLALIVALIAGALVFGGVCGQLDRKVKARRSYSAESAPQAAPDIPNGFVNAYREAMYPQDMPAAPNPRLAPASAQGHATADADTTVSVATVVLCALAAVLNLAFLSYLVASALVFVARLVVGVG